MLSDRVKELIQKFRIVSFAQWRSKYSDEVIEIFQQADDQGIYLTDENIKQIVILAPELTNSTKIAQILRDRAEKIVSQARVQVLAVYPQITEPGGDLYPPARAEACWRDFWHFLRCITYGIAGQTVQSTSESGLSYMKQLYQELKVPLNAMVLGLEQLKYYSLQEFEQQQQLQLAPYFDHLIDKMRSFSAIAN